jgi:hypothetical protein
LARVGPQLFDQTFGGIAHRARFSLHLRRIRRLIRGLEAKDLREPNVLAILAVETFYRPAAVRMLEYVLWLALSAFGLERIRSMSIGRAQVQLVHWRDLGLIDSVRFSFGRLARVRSLESNYEACRRYLHRREALGEPDPEVLAAAYTGGPRPDYSSMLTAARAAMERRPVVPVVVPN